jgi:hypothetical protein
MWSPRFLWTGLSSGVVIAALTLAELWLALFVVSGSRDPSWTIANVVKFTLPGLIVYSVCWYAVIFRRRNYSLYRTLALVLATFAAVSAVVAVLTMAAGLYVGITAMLAVSQPWKFAPFVMLGPFAYALMTMIGVAFLIIPYMIVATPMALLHRWLLLKIFVSTGSSAPTVTPSLSGAP